MRDSTIGVRLWIDDVPLIDRWDSGANMTAAKASLKAATFYRIKLEYCSKFIARFNRIHCDCALQVQGCHRSR
jgi:hypothetical protein